MFLSAGVETMLSRSVFPSAIVLVNRSRFGFEGTYGHFPVVHRFSFGLDDLKEGAKISQASFEPNRLEILNQTRSHDTGVSIGFSRLVPLIIFFFGNFLQVEYSPIAGVESSENARCSSLDTVQGRYSTPGH